MEALAKHTSVVSNASSSIHFTSYVQCKCVFPSSLAHGMFEANLVAQSTIRPSAPNAMWPIKPCLKLLG
eukprot:3724987-Amphidinium_carterae.1